MDPSPFTEATGDAGVGIIVRDHRGAVRLSAWRVIFGANNAEKVEAMACREGLNLVAQWSASST